MPNGILTLKTRTDHLWTEDYSCKRKTEFFSHFSVRVAPAKLQWFGFKKKINNNFAEASWSIFEAVLSFFSCFLLFPFHLFVPSYYVHSLRVPADRSLLEASFIFTGFAEGVILDCSSKGLPKEPRTAEMRSITAWQLSTWMFLLGLWLPWHKVG